MPAFADLLVRYKDTPSYLISDNKGGLDICHNGHALLNGRSDQWSEECKSNFYTSSTNTSTVILVDDLNLPQNEFSPIQCLSSFT